jgi:hypothetical protein
MSKLCSRTSEILAVLDKHGGMLSLTRLAQYCWQEGVWSPQEKDQMAFAAAKRQCHNALKTKNSLGLPVAGPSPRLDQGAPVWVQLQFWDEETCRYNIAIRLRQVQQDFSMIEALQRYYAQRWGTPPVIPRLVLPDEAEIWWVDTDPDAPTPLDDDED